MLGAEGTVGEVLPLPPSAQPSWRGTAAAGPVQEAEAGLWGLQAGFLLCLHLLLPAWPCVSCMPEIPQPEMRRLARTVTPTRRNFMMTT